MTSVLSGDASFNISFWFSTPLLQPSGHSSGPPPELSAFTSQASFHLLPHQIYGSLQKKPFSRNTVYLQDHACKSFPTKSVMSHAQSMETLTLKDGAESKLTFHQSMQFFNILYTYPVNIRNPTYVFYKLHTDIFWIYDICLKRVQKVLKRFPASLEL